MWFEMENISIDSDARKELYPNLYQAQALRKGLSLASENQANLRQKTIL
jgi:hypothetical protein